jgi:hypothetical protein
MPPEKTRTSDHELVQDGGPIAPEILEMRDEDGAKIKHFLPAHHLRTNMQDAHQGLPPNVVLIVEPSTPKKRAGGGNQRSQLD